MDQYIVEVPRLLERRERDLEHIADLCKKQLAMIKKSKRRFPAMQRLCEAMSWGKKAPKNSQLDKFRRYELELKAAGVIDTDDKLTY